MSARPDLTAPRPWKAEPTDPARPEDRWQVVAPSRFAHGEPYLVAAHLSEADARTIALAPELEELLTKGVLKKEAAP